MKDRLSELRKEIIDLTTQLNIDEFEQELDVLVAKSKSPNFWNDNLSAQLDMKRIAAIEAKVNPWKQIKSSIDEVDELLQLDDESIYEDLEEQLDEVEEKIRSLKKDLRFNGQYDSFDAILNIYAGAGGTDAQDWAQMLLRMYTRWIDKNGYVMNIVDETNGEEAGIKSVTMDVSGPYVYGKLKGENGVHRLIRLSPFNADNLRQTSFAKVEVLPKIEHSSDIELDEKDLKVDVFRSGGHGGQSVNTTDSAVRITHIPTGIVVTIQNERSQTQNKAMALTILRSKLAQLKLEQHKKDLADIKGPNQAAEWGNQVRSYVMHPYKQVRDSRTKYETSDIESVLDGSIDGFIDSFLDHNLEHPEN